jgi:hypothetical protein
MIDVPAEPPCDSGDAEDHILDLAGHACPACGAPLDRCPGDPEMPTSQDYWQCNRCGLCAHVSRLITDHDRRSLVREYTDSLRDAARQGRAARSSLRAIRGRRLGRGPVGGLAATGLAALAAVLIGRRIRRRRRD